MLGIVLALSLTHAQSLYERRAGERAQESADYYHALYQQRTVELTGWLENKLNQAAAPYGGARRFDYRIPPKVVGSNYMTFGISFETERGDLGCYVDSFDYDLISSCRTAAYTGCADFKVTAVCLDKNKQTVVLRSAPSRRLLN